jgi:hypothetical protein
MSPGNAKVKVSNLPLLFVKGNPTSLELMSLEDLQSFLRFVIKCEGNRKDFPDLDELETPIWWPNDFEFSETILMKQEKNRGKLALLLKKAIKSCYNFHECAFLIEFCRKLLDYTGGVENLQVINNGDGTRSLIKRRDKKLLVTFKAENQDYDKEYKKPGKKSLDSRFSISSPMKTKESRRLLQTLPAATTSDPAMSKCLAELYLCDTCDITFESLPLLIAHERTCAQPEVESVVEPTIKHKKKQSQLLAYLKLMDKKKPAEKKQLNEDERPKAASYEKFMEIDVSSPLGSYIIRGSKLQLDQQHPASRSMRGFMTAEDYNNQVESKCPGTILRLKGSNAFADIRTKYPNVYRGQKRKSGSFVHIYTFSRKQRLDRYRDLKRGLTPHSYRMWRRANKQKSEVRIKRIGSPLTKFYLAKYHLRMARLAAQDAQGEDTDMDTSSTHSFSQPLSELHIQTPSLTPDSSPSHSPRLTVVRNYHRSRQSSPGSAITIETSDSDADITDRDMEDNLRVKILVKPPKPDYSYHTPSSSHEEKTTSPLISVKLIEPLDEFEPTSPKKEIDEDRTPASTINNVGAITPSSRFVPSIKISGLSANRIHKSKSRHIPNILLKSKQSQIVARQLTQAASATIVAELDSSPPSPLAALGLEPSKPKGVSPQRSIPRAQMLTQGRQQSPAAHINRKQTMSPVVCSPSPQKQSTSTSPTQQTKSPTQPTKSSSPTKQPKSLSPTKQTNSPKEQIFFAKKSRFPAEVECVDLSSGEE